MNADHIQTRPNSTPRSRAAELASRPAGTADQPGAASEFGENEATVHAAAPEFVQLAARLRELPATRPEMIQAVKERLAAGYYLTRDSAVQAAGAIVAR